jgi:cytochrome bd-type quinol oxidase subunit 2
MAEALYLVCVVMSITCALMLLRGYRQTRMKLLFWSCLCFVGLSLNNVLLFVDLIIVPSVDLSVWRASTTFVSIVLLLYGFVFETR